MLLFLVGYMGCGKSTIGRKLSAKIGYELVDTDHLIEEREGLSVGEIFEKFGEARFREMEREVLVELINSGESCIVSTGGGLPLFGDNMELMNGAGLTIYLHRTAENIASRLSPSGRHKRPKLRGLNDEELVAFMSKNIEERYPTYLKANCFVDAVPMNDDEILEFIESKMKK